MTTSRTPEAEANAARWPKAAAKLDPSVIIVQDPTGKDVLVVERVSYTATFELRYNGHDFYTTSSGAYVAVAR